MTTRRERRRESERRRVVSEFSFDGDRVFWTIASEGLQLRAGRRERTTDRRDRRE